MRIARFFLISILCFLPQSCSKKDTKDPQTLKTYAQTEPLSLDPRIAGTRNCQIFLRHLFEGLTTLTPKGTPILAGAKSVEISTDGCLYTFKLKKTYWSNGDEVTADDYEYAWKSILTPSFPSSYAYAFWLIKNAREAKQGEKPLDSVGIKALDKETLVVKLNHPAPYFLEFLANPIYSPVSKKQEEKNPHWAKNGGSEYVCNGAFSLKKWQHNDGFTLEKNPLYRLHSRIKLHAIDVAIVEDPLTALALFDKGELDLVGEPFGFLPHEAIPQLQREKKLCSQFINNVYFLEVNTKHPLLQNEKIRKALSMSINRKELIEGILQGNEKPAFSILPPLFSALETPPYSDQDIDNAQELFAQGLQELGLKKEALPPLTISHWSLPREKAVAAILQQQWKEAFHIPITLEAYDWNSYWTNISSGSFHIAGTTWFSWYKDPMYNLELMKYASKGLNSTHWENKKYTSLLDTADITLNEHERRAILKEAESILIEELPLIPVYYATYKFLKNPHLKGLYITPLGQLELKHAYFDNKDN